MTHQRLTDELSDLRCQIMCLQQREAALQHRLAGAGDGAAQPPARRPGWPIRRVNNRDALH